jgi:drug/metabolite transporter (DMT)-like permease
MSRLRSEKFQDGWHAPYLALRDPHHAVKPPAGDSPAFHASPQEAGVQPAQREAADTTAKLMLLLLSLAWGLTWPAMRVALGEIPVFSMRAVSLGLGALTLVIVVAAQRRKVMMPNATAWAHVFVAAILNIVGFSLLSSFALLQAATSRVAILSYTMPIWAALFAWLVLGERLDRARIVALAMCVAGMTVLIAPLAGAGIPVGLLLALGTGVSWAAGTVYLKWARIDADPVVVAAWQLVIGFLVVAIALAFVEGGLHITQAHLPAVSGMVFTGWVGSGLAYFLWFKIVGRLPAMTASLGILSTPVVGVISTAALLGEWPTVPDIAGFALIFAASACVLLPSREAAAPEPV